MRRRFYHCGRFRVLRLPAALLTMHVVQLVNAVARCCNRSLSGAEAGALEFFALKKPARGIFFSRLPCGVGQNLCKGV
jgi:hypothetical protein